MSVEVACVPGARESMEPLVVNDSISSTYCCLINCGTIPECKSSAKLIRAKQFADVGTGKDSDQAAMWLSCTKRRRPFFHGSEARSKFLRVPALKTRSSQGSCRPTRSENDLCCGEKAKMVSLTFQ